MHKHSEYGKGKYFLDILTEFNSIHSYYYPQNDHGEAVVDEMKLELKDMKIANVNLIEGNDDCDGVEECLDSAVNILNPTSFTLNIKRNLSSGWYKELPELDVSARLKSIEANLLPTDYHLLMSILAKNMTEGADEFVVVAPLPKRPEIGMCDSRQSRFGLCIFVIWLIDRYYYLFWSSRC